MFWIAKLTTDNHPTVADMKLTVTQEEAAEAAKECRAGFPPR